MTTRRALRCLALSLSSLAFALGGFAGCGGGDDSTAGADAGKKGDAAVTDATTDDSGSCAGSLTACGVSCVDEQNDPRNCGACGVVCGTGTDCESGACVAPCLSGQSRCSGRCVAFETDNANCGSCGTSCGTGLVCSEGACTVACAPPLTTCYAGDGVDAGATDAGDDAASDASADAAADASDAARSTVDAAAPAPVRYCARTASDESNCGGCGLTCPAGKQCDDGVCSDTCSIGQTLCSSVCRDLSTDLANCGACGQPCGSGQVCSGGVCQATCGMPFTLCGGSCANTASDPLHCGSCTTSCSPANTKAPACSSGNCNYVGCQGGFADCDSNVANGCELSTASDVNNCGGCGVHCGGANVKATACSGGACGYTQCTDGFADCDGVLANGCEADLASPLSCGKCGVRCGASDACTSAGCVPPTSFFLPDFGGTPSPPGSYHWTISTGHAGDVVYYTLDGSVPTTSSAHGASPLTLTNVTTTADVPVQVAWITSSGASTSGVQYRTVTNSTPAQNTFTGAITTDLMLAVGRAPAAGDGPVLVVLPGQTVNAVASALIVDNACAGCSDVLAVGTTSVEGCPFNAGFKDWPGTPRDPLTFSLTAPPAPGTYSIHVGVTGPAESGCVALATLLNQSFRDDTAMVIGKLIVQ